MAINVMLCSEERYLFNQLKLLLGEDTRTFAVFAFSGTDRARNYLEKEQAKIQCVLADENTAGQLGELDVPVILLGEYTSTGMDEGQIVLNVFQKKSAVLDDLRQLMRGLGLMSNVPVRMGSTKVVSFFSTQGGSGTSTLAYLTAMTAAEEGKVVYMNLETAPVVDRFYANQGRSAEEFLCGVKERESAQNCLQPALWRNEHDVYCLPVPVSMADQKSLDQEDIQYLINGIIHMDDVDYLIIDVSGGLTPRTEYVMSVSDRVALVFSDDAAGESKRRRLLEDPAFAIFPFAGHEMVVGNRCMKKEQGDRFDACFPVSNSIGGGVDMQQVYQGNPELRASCKAILQL